MLSVSNCASPPMIGEYLFISLLYFFKLNIMLWNYCSRIIFLNNLWLQYFFFFLLQEIISFHVSFILVTGSISQVNSTFNLSSLFLKYFMFHRFLYLIELQEIRISWSSIKYRNLWNIKYINERREILGWGNRLRPYILIYD